MLQRKKRLLVLIIGAGLTLAVILPRGTSQPFAPQIVYAAGKTCPDVVKAALQSVDTGCSSTSRNSLCYGNVQVQVTPQADAPQFTFAKPGDKAPLKNIQTIQLSSLSADANDWGIALMRIQANLPDTAPGQNVTMLLFGNVNISDGSTTAAYPTDEPTVFVSPPAPLPTFTPTISGKIASTPRATPRPSNTPKPTLTPTITPTPLPTTPPTPPAFKSMQAFYFSSGVGEPSCNEAPEDGILIQAPQGSQRITLLVDDARVDIGSTVFFQAQAGKEMIISTLEGSAVVTAFGQTALVNAGSRVHVPIDANLKASGPPSQPEPYDLNVMKVLPARHLPLKVTPAAPIPTLAPGFTGSTWRVVFGPEGIPNATCSSFGGTYYFPMAVNASGDGIQWDKSSGSGSGGSYSVTYTHGEHYVFHFTSPTHGVGTYSYTSDCQGHGGGFEMDLVGGPQPPLAVSTAAATAPQ